MTRKFSLIAILAAFLVLSAWALYHVGLVGLLQGAFSNPGSIQIFIDLGLACGVAWVFMWPDAKRRGVNPIPYAILTLGLGSIGLLAYMIRREWAPEATG